MVISKAVAPTPRPRVRPSSSLSEEGTAGVEDIVREEIQSMEGRQCSMLSIAIGIASYNTPNTSSRNIKTSLEEGKCTRT